MNRFRWQTLVSLAALLAAAPAAHAQRMQLAQQDPHLGYVYPAGGREGTTFEATLGGQYLGDASAVYVSGQGVQATLGKYHRPLTPPEMNRIREKLEEARKRMQSEKPNGLMRDGFAGFIKLAHEAGVTDEQLQGIMEFRKRMADPKQQLNAQIAETLALKVTLAADAAPGPRELRLLTASGLSNPLRFEVGQLPEYRENEPNDKTPDAGIRALPVVINGQILPGDVDRFAFRARKGTRLVINASARELIPYLADAVPGWFQAALALYDPKGHQVAYADAYRVQLDPTICYEVPDDGLYVLEIRDAIYRGREDFVYRIALGELPLVTSIFPLGGRQGMPTAVDVQGWNLPLRKLSLAAAEQGPGILPLSLFQDAGLAQRVSFDLDTLPECLEQEPNDQPSAAQRLTLPVIVNGRIDRPGDRDVFRFEGRAGSEIVAEVFARRLGSPLDSLLKLTDAAGRVLAANDDYEDKGAGLTTHQADSRLSTTLPADGTYYLHLSDVQHNGSAEHAYRLHVGPPRPDFALRVVPSSVCAHAGTTVPITVYALRRDGFSADIRLALNDAPPGFILSGGWVPAGQDQVRFTLTVPQDQTKTPLRLSLEGRAVIQGREVRRVAVPAEDMLQAFAYHHLVPARNWMAVVTPRDKFRPTLKFSGAGSLKLRTDETAPLRLLTPPQVPMGRIRLQLSDPPEGIALETVSSDYDSVSVRVRTDAKKAKPGLKGNLIVDAFFEFSPPGGNRQGKRLVPLGMLPAVPFEVVAR